MSSSPESGRVKKGAVNVAKIGMAACKSRTALTVRKGASLRRATAGAMVKPHGSMSKQVEFGAGSLCMDRSPPVRAGCCPSLVVFVVPTGYAHYGYAVPPAPKRGTPVQPGVQPNTYRTKGCSFEHVNLDLSAASSEAQQAAESGDVSGEGRSLRCSPSTGKPCTWR